MISNTPTNPLELKDLILSRLGAPVIQVEVTEDQVMECISRAVELFTEFLPDGTNRAYICVPVTEELAESRIITFEFPVYAVECLVRARSDFFSMMGGATYNWYSDYIFSISSSYSTQSMSSNGMVYGASSGLSTYYQTQSNLNMMYDMLDPLYEFWFNEPSNTLELKGDLVEDEMLVFRVWVPTASLVSDARLANAGSKTVRAGINPLPTEQEKWKNHQSQWVNAQAGTPFADQAVYNNRWVKDMATAYTKQVNGTILKKHTGMTLPGGVTIDGQSMYDEATQEIERLREEMMANEKPLGVIWG